MQPFISTPILAFRLHFRATPSNFHSQCTSQAAAFTEGLLEVCASLVQAQALKSYTNHPSFEVFANPSRKVQVHSIISSHVLNSLSFNEDEMGK